MEPQGALSFTELVLNASFLVQCVMLFLLGLSIASWTIIISRNNTYRQGRAKADEFEERFWSGIDLNQLYQDCMKRPDELVGLEVIYSAGFKEFVRLVNSGPADQEVVMDGTYRQMKVACSREVELLESNLPMLATIGSISPYIGLFGTVWGIMHAFVALAAVKNATLAMVAPPIAEALIATAMGLFAAIPAVMFYNRFVTKVEALENRYYNFMDEFSTILNRRLVTIRTQLNRNALPNQNQAPAVTNMAVPNIPGTTPPNTNNVGAGNESDISSNEQNRGLSNNNAATNSQPQNPNTITNLSEEPDPKYNVAMENSSSQAQAMAQSMSNMQNANNGMNRNAPNNGKMMNMGAQGNANMRDMGSREMGRFNKGRGPQGNGQMGNQGNMNYNMQPGMNNQMNDPRMAQNYRGVVPPRGQGGMNNGMQPNLGAANNGAKAQQAPKQEGSVYKVGHDNDRFRNQKIPDEEPRYISPGGQNSRKS